MNLPSASQFDDQKRQPRRDAWRPKRMRLQAWPRMLSANSMCKRRHYSSFGCSMRQKTDIVRPRSLQALAFCCAIVTELVFTSAGEAAVAILKSNTTPVMG